jgi:hypothetical protein
MIGTQGAKGHRRFGILSAINRGMRVADRESGTSLEKSQANEAEHENFEWQSAWRYGVPDPCPGRFEQRGKSGDCAQYGENIEDAHDPTLPASLVGSAREAAYEVNEIA